MWLAMDETRGRTKGFGGSAGFSLAEILMATAISSVVLLALYLLYDINQVTFLKGEQQADLQQNARIAMDRIIRELRLMGSDPSGTLTGGPAPPGGGPGGQANCANPPPATPQAIENAEATCIRLYADVDSQTPLATERVEYSYDCAAQRVRRQVWTATGSGGAQPLAERVTGLVFTYYDANNNILGGGPVVGCPPPSNAVPVGSLSSIQRISVTITTQDAQTGSKAQPFTLRAEVRPRNLGL
jgi:prepilin-type N-terminal cleavage/methylation domain-containing protein